MKPGDRVDIECTGLSEDGRGVGVAAGTEVSAADLLPGERAEVALEHCSPHRARAWGRVARRLGPPSADRVEPACPAFGRCGGCAWQHLAYPAQLDEKRARLERALGGIAAVGPVAAAPRALGYRNRGKYVFAPGAPGAPPLLGAYQPRSHQVVSTLGCRVVEPPIDACARALAGAIAELEMPVYDEATRRGAARYAVIRSGEDGAAVALFITTSEASRRDVEAIAERLVPAAAAGLSWMKNDSKGGALFAGGDCEPVAGAARVTEIAGGARIALPVTAFWQINRAQGLRLHHRIAELLDAGGGTRVIDAYAGAAAIGLTLAAGGARVRAVEREAAAVAAGRAAAVAAGLDVELEAGDAAAALAAGGFDAAVVNPPRKGLSEAARGALAASGAGRIAYLSCGPESLARDLGELATAGYRVAALEAFDLMPGTGQVETLAILERVPR